MKKSILAAAVALVSLSALSTENGAVGAKISTLGVGAEYSFPVQKQLDIGVSANYFNYKKNFDQDDLKVDGTARLLTLGVIGYYYPWDNGFNINGGLYYNGNKVDLHAEPKGAARTYTINDQTYTSDEIADADGNVDFNKIAPYVGIGWKSGTRSEAGFAFDANLGVMFHGTPTVSFGAKCTGQLAQNQALCDELQKNIAAERDDMQKDADDFKFYPVASIGFVYRF